MEFNVNNIDDIVKYYKGTYVKLKESGDTLLKVELVDKESGVWCISGVTDTGGGWKLWLDEDNSYEVDYILPNKSFFQFENRAVMLVRIPAQQYQRGISSKNTSLRYLAANGKIAAVDISMELLKTFVNKQQFKTITEATMLAESPNSHCLSSRMMMMGHLIYVDFVAVARVTLSSKKELQPSIFMKAPIFRNEVEQLMKQNNETFRVLP
jgi:hypothetical protein